MFCWYLLALRYLIDFTLFYNATIAIHIITTGLPSDAARREDHGARAEPQVPFQQAQVSMRSLWCIGVSMLRII